MRTGDDLEFLGEDTKKDDQVSLKGSFSRLEGRLKLIFLFVFRPVQADIQECPESNNPSSSGEAASVASSPSRFQIHRQLVDDNDGLKYR